MSQIAKPVEPNSFEVTKLTYDGLSIMKSKSGQESKKVRMRYDKKEFKILTPLAKVPFGLNTSKEDEKSPSQYKKYSFSISFEDTPELNEFKKLIEQIDEQNVKYILSQKDVKEWGLAGLSPDVIASRYESMIKKDKKGSYPGTLKIKLPFYEGTPSFKVYDSNNKMIKWYSSSADVDWSWAKKYMHIRSYIECEGLYLVNKSVYCCFKMRQCLVVPPEIEECCFGKEIVEKKEDSEEEEDDEVEKVEKEVKKITIKKKEKDQIVEDEEEEEEEDDQDNQGDVYEEED